MEMECSGRVWEPVRQIREVRAAVYLQEEVGISATDVGRPESDWVVCLELVDIFANHTHRLTEVPPRIHHPRAQQLVVYP